MAPTIVTTVTRPAGAQFDGGGQFDLVALDDVKEELQITGTGDDDWLAKVITRASAAASRYCNRVFQVQGYRDQFWAYRDPYPWQLPSGTRPLQLSQWPIASAPSVAGVAPPAAPVLSAGAGGALPAARYYVKVTYVTAAGETAASLESNLAVAAANVLQVSAPGSDLAGLATGWNVYVGSTSFGETKQNTDPIGVGTGWTELTSGLITGATLPGFTLVVQTATNPTALIEGIDFLSDADHGQLTRLFPIDGYERSWPGLPLTVEYLAGYAEIPDDVQDAVLTLVKARWFSRTRDPQIRSENAAGIYEAAYWFGAGPGSSGNLPPNVMAALDQYRVPVTA